MSAARQVVECADCGATFDPNEYGACPECRGNV